MHGSLWMVRGIFYAFDGRRLDRLFLVRKFFHALIGSIFNGRKLLRITRLSRAVSAGFVRTVLQLIHLRFIVTTRSIYHSILLKFASILNAGVIGGLSRMRLIEMRWPRISGLENCEY
jgi:uncharacterized membrane protein